MYKYSAAPVFIIFIILILSPAVSAAEINYYTVLKGRIIMLDSGHGGEDSGAVRSGVRESDLNLKTALYLKKYLEEYGARVLMTRETDAALSLNERFERMEREKPDLFISLHHNDASDDFYSKPEFKNYAEVYFSSLFNGGYENIICGKNFFNAFKTLYKVNDVRLKPGYFKVIRSKIVPSVLIEPYFMGDKKLIKLAATQAYIKHEARIYLRAIAEYFNAAGAAKQTDLPSSIPSSADFSNDTCELFFSAGEFGNKKDFLFTAGTLLNLNEIKTFINSENFLKGGHISSYYISKLLSIKEILQPEMISAYIEAVRSNAANARVHISISFDRNLPDAVYTYYRSDNGRRLAKLIKENFINAGITLEFKPASFYILSSTSAVTAVINLNPDTIKIHNNHIISKINFALVKAVKLYFNKF